jgi:predicted nucleic acid-binding protein
MDVTPATAWLVDKSALVRIAHSSDADVWFDRAERGFLHITTPTLLEVGFSSRSGPDWHRVTKDPPVGLMPIENLTPRIEQRAVEVQGILAGLGEHRAPSIPDLLIAATAELAGLTVLHVDKDFDLIARVTNQPTERLTLPVRHLPL